MKNLDIEKIAVSIKKGVKYFFKYYLIIVVFLLLSFFMFRNSFNARNNYSDLSLRYNESPLDPSMVSSAKKSIEENKKSLDYRFSFWFENNNANLSSDKTSVSTDALFVDGDVRSVYPVDFISGAYPSELDKEGLAISEILAWKLFGGTQLSGMEVSFEGKTYYVSGVFKGKDPLMLIQCDAEKMKVDSFNERAAFDGEVYQSAGFTGITLSGEAQGNPEQLAIKNLETVGLPRPDVFIGESWISSVIRLFAWIPYSIIIVYFIVLLVSFMRKGISYIQRQIIWFLILIALAFIVPVFMGKLPGWIIPTKWSDTSHWAGVIENIRVLVNDWLNLKPYEKDLQMIWAIIAQAALLLPTMFAAAGCVSIWNKRIKEAGTVEKTAGENAKIINGEHESDEDMMEELELIRKKSKEREKI